MSDHNGNGKRHVTPSPAPLYHDSAHYWCGRLGMAVAVAQKAPQTAREALEEYLRSPVVSAEVRNMIRAELKQK